MTTQFQIGDSVEAGKPGTEDHDTGRIVSIGGDYDGRVIRDDEAVVAWDSGVRTPIDLADLRPA